MCRIMAIVGSFKKNEIREILKSFSKMAQGKYEINELNTKKGKFKHDSGWGVVYNKYRLYNSINPIWKDKNLEKFQSTQISLLHARKASIGSIKIENTHPFKKIYKNKKWFFCHNGTIKEDFQKYRNLQGDTDSEKFFLYLLKNFNEKKPIKSISNAIRKLNKYTSLNSFILNKDFLYVIYKNKKYHKYHQLKMLKKDKAIIISSEVLSGLINQSNKWQTLSNGKVLEINLKTLEVKTN